MAVVMRPTIEETKARDALERRIDWLRDPMNAGLQPEGAPLTDELVQNLMHASREAGRIWGLA